jgi:hypothetical protein
VLILCLDGNLTTPLKKLLQIRFSEPDQTADLPMRNPLPANPKIKSLWFNPQQRSGLFDI